MNVSDRLIEQAPVVWVQPGSGGRHPHSKGARAGRGLPSRGQVPRFVCYDAWRDLFCVYSAGELLRVVTGGTWFVACCGG